MRKGKQALLFSPPSPRITSRLLSFARSRFVTSAPNSWFSRINISFPPSPHTHAPSLGRHAVICVTPGNVHCHLGADCSAAAADRSVRTGRPLMRGARQSRAHFQKNARLAILSHRRPLAPFPTLFLSPPRSRRCPILA